MIGYYNYTVILTYIGAAAGFTGITYAWNENTRAALICLLISGLCDMFDGKIASTMKRTPQEKRFGVQIDSLSDLICFGVLPAVIMMQISCRSVPAVLISTLYLLCALIRLAWFNVDEEERQNTEKGGRKEYLGLPVTSAALFTPFYIGIHKIICLPVHTYLPWLMLCSAAAFLIPFSVDKPGWRGKLLLLLSGIATFTAVVTGRVI